MLSKYEDIEKAMKKSTIPFYEIPKILVVTSKDIESLQVKRLNCDIDFLDLNLNKLFRYI
jgi:hypothetical protein